jgi:hypothetical protein
MDCGFFHWLLIILLISSGILIIWQTFYMDPSNNTNNTKNNNSRKSEPFMPIIWDTCKNSRMNGIKNEGLSKGVFYSGQPVHRVGPVINFHQSFKPVLHELGWRNYYLNKYNDYEVPKDSNFDGTIIRNFLDNMESVDNIYRKCN